LSSLLDAFPFKGAQFLCTLFFYFALCHFGPAFLAAWTPLRLASVKKSDMVFRIALHSLRKTNKFLPVVMHRIALRDEVFSSEQCLLRRFSRRMPRAGAYYPRRRR